MPARPVFSGLGELPVEPAPVGFRPPARSYACYRTESPITIDGFLDEEAWQFAPRMEGFVDILGLETEMPFLKTLVRMLWDERFLYVAADLEEHDVWGTLTQRDSHVCRDNDFEIFVDPDSDARGYIEVEINALNTVFDLVIDKPFSEGGLPNIEFDFVGLRHAVQVDGTLNWPHDVDRGWTLEVAFPWDGFRSLTSQSCPPHEGDNWRMNFARVHWERQNLGGDPLQDCGMSVWSPPGAFNMHIPDNWGSIVFSETPVGRKVDPK